MNPTLQLVMIGAMSFGLLFAIARSGPVGWWVVAALVLLAAISAAAVYVLRFHRAVAARLNAAPVLRQYLEIVAKMSKEQPPSVEKPSREGRQKRDSEEDGLLLEGPNDFARAERDLKYYVRGQDAAIETLLAHLKESLILRKSRKRSHEGAPLGVFLIAGEEGIGKLHLGLMMARALYRGGDVTVIDGRAYAQAEMAMADLFGTAGQCGRLVAAIRSRPEHTIIIEHIDALGAKVLESLRTMFLYGAVHDEAGRPVNVQDTLFLLCTTKGTSSIRAVEAKGLAGDERRRVLVEVLTSETPLEPPFLSQMSDVICLSRLSPMSKAEIIGLLMRAECRKYHVVLDFVDADILASEVSAISDAYGMKEAPARVVRLLKPAIADVVAAGRARVVLAKEDLDVQSASDGAAQHVGGMRS